MSMTTIIEEPGKHKRKRSNIVEDGETIHVRLSVMDSRHPGTPGQYRGTDPAAHNALAIKQAVDATRKAMQRDQQQPTGGRADYINRVSNAWRSGQ